MDPPRQMPSPDEIAALFAARPWAGDAAFDPGPAAAVPTMLSPEEQRFYVWLGAAFTRGKGEVVDLGCFAGGSTARLAEGVRRGAARIEGGGGARPLVHAFDRFEIDPARKRRYLYPAGVPEFRGKDMLPVVRQLLEPWEDGVTFHPGDIAGRGWREGHIEVLVVDAAKTAALADHIAATFFPELIPGVSILVQQDFLQPLQPWLPAQMALFADRLRPLAFLPRSAMVYLCTAPVTAEAVRAGQMVGRDDAEITRLVQATARICRPFAGRARFRSQIRKLRKRPGARSTSAMRQAEPGS